MAEIAALALAMPPVIEQLIKISKLGYDLVEGGRNMTKNFQDSLLPIGISRARFEEWDQARIVACGGDDLSRVIDPKSRRYQLVLLTIVKIGGIFTDIKQLEGKYGIVKEDQLPPVGNASGVGRPKGKERAPQGFVRQQPSENSTSSLYDKFSSVMSLGRLSVASQSSAYPQNDFNTMLRFLTNSAWTTEHQYMN